MDSLLIVCGVIGALIGWQLATPTAPVLGALLGMLAAAGIVESSRLRANLAQLTQEVKELRRRLVAAQTPPDAHREAAASAEPAPASAPADMSVARVRSDEPFLREIRELFAGVNLMVRIGVVVLFFGLAFLLRYVAEHSHVSAQTRLAGVSGAALAMLALGWRLRRRRSGYALTLQGGAIGILYLVLFSAQHLYALLTPPETFGIMVLLAAACGALAIAQDALAVAVIGVAFAFLAPFLAWTTHTAEAVLFGYFLVLNGAVLALAWLRSWRLLNLLGFAFTFVLGVIWGVLQYRPQAFHIVEPFLVLFFLMYSAIPVLESLRARPDLRHPIDGTLVFGVPIAAFGSQAALLAGQPHELAASALALGALYGALVVLLRRLSELTRPLTEAFTALGVAFATLAIPLALNARWTASSWAIEGASLVWIGCRQDRHLPRAFGMLLAFGSGIALAITAGSDGLVPPGTWIAAAVAGVAAVLSGVWLHRHAVERGTPIRHASALFLWGVIEWCAGGVDEIDRYVLSASLGAAWLAFAAATAAAAGEIACRKRFAAARVTALALLPAMACNLMFSGLTLEHPFEHFGWCAWPAAIAAFYFILWRNEQALESGTREMSHAAALWLVTALLGWESWWLAGRAAAARGAWSACALALVAVGVLALMPAAERIRWPFGAHRRAYQQTASTGLAAFLGAWSVWADFAVSSPSAPLRYLPLLNPLDLAQCAVLIALLRLVRCLPIGQAPAAPITRETGTAALAALAFLWINALLLRSLHFAEGLPYELAALLGSSVVEASLSILWASLSVLVMVTAARARRRRWWLAGSGLLALVVVKLFLVELANAGTVERIVSFVGVGVLMMLLGYLSPLPPAQRAEDDP